MSNKYFLATNGYVVNAEGSWIPPEPANSDYQKYLEWVAEGNTAEEWDPQG